MNEEEFELVDKDCELEEIEPTRSDGNLSGFDLKYACKSKYKKKKGQGAFEYVLLLGGVILIVVLAVVLLRGGVFNVPVIPEPGDLVDDDCLNELRLFKWFCGSYSSVKVSGVEWFRVAGQEEISCIRTEVPEANYLVDNNGGTAQYCVLTEDLHFEPNTRNALIIKQFIDTGKYKLWRDYS